MKTSKATFKKLMLTVLSVIAVLSLMVLAVAAEEPATSPEAPKTETFAQMMRGIFSGTNVALLGVALAIILPCMGSAKGVGIVGEAASGLLSENPSLFGKALVLQALPMTQGVYGLVVSFLMLIKLGLFGNVAYLQGLTFAQGGYYLMASLPIALAGFYSAIRQARVAASGISLLAKRPGEVGKAITSAALVETYAIFALLISILLVFKSPFAA